MDIENGPTKIAASQEYFDLGKYHRTITTQSADAQAWFNRGLIWSFSFNHEEAVKCFQQVILHDPLAAMGHWGIAYASGPNYNKTWAAFDAADLKKSALQTYEATRRAKEVMATAQPWEKAVIEALQHRFPVEHALDDYSGANKAYADAMRAVYEEHGDGDLDVISLFVDALMNVAPRKMFDMQSGVPNPSSPVFELQEVFAKSLVLKKARTHPGLPHLWIHFMEMSATPEKALNVANDLRNLVPDGGHMFHMPTHIDILVGDYERSIDYNTRAVDADDKFYAKNGGRNFYSFYRLHNYHSLIYAAMLAGKRQVALDATSRMEATITEEMLRVESPPYANWMEFFLSVRAHVLIRFGMWDEIKDLALPEDRQLYCVTTAMFLYAKGIAFAATGAVARAEEIREQYRDAASRVPETRMDFPNKVVDILRVATAMLDGELEYRRANYDLAFEKLREAIKWDDAIHYTEPWGWMLPTRHSYGALSLEQGLVEQAATAYAEDLGLSEGLVRVHQHPNNVWALHGYYECLVRLDRRAEARLLEGPLRLASALADVPIESSCFCRLQKKTVHETKQACCK